MYFSWCVDLEENARFALIFKPVFRKKKPRRSIDMAFSWDNEIGSLSFAQDIMFKYKFYSQKII